MVPTPSTIRDCEEPRYGGGVEPPLWPPRPIGLDAYTGVLKSLHNAASDSVSPSNKAHVKALGKLWHGVKQLRVTRLRQKQRRAPFLHVPINALRGSSGRKVYVRDQAMGSNRHPVAADPPKSMAVVHGNVYDHAAKPVSQDA